MTFKRDPNCTCITCHSCHGLGNITVEDLNAAEGWDLEICPDCHGLGVDECEQCAWEREEYETEYYGRDQTRPIILNQKSWEN